MVYSLSMQNNEVSRGVAIFAVSAYLIIVYVTSINIIHSLSTHSHVQSENLCEIELYSVHELALIVRSVLTVYNCIDYSYKRLRDTSNIPSCVVKTPQPRMDKMVKSADPHTKWNLGA